MQQCERREVLCARVGRKVDVGKRLVDNATEMRYSTGGYILSTDRHPSYEEKEVVPSTDEEDEGEASAWILRRSFN